MMLLLMLFSFKERNKTTKAEAQTDRGGESNLTMKNQLHFGRPRRSLESIPNIFSNSKKSLKNTNPN